MEATMSSRYFPSELLFDILIKLTVKTLIRFQCVSKSFRALITDPTFISTHRDRCAANSHSGGGTYFIKFWCDERYCLSHVDDRKLGIHENVLKLPDELVGSDIEMNITGSCRDLLCFTAEQYHGFPCDVYLWNPSIRVVKKLPDSNISLPPKFKVGYSSYICGIGFDSRTNDYKVVQMIYGDEDYCAGSSYCRIYSLSTNSWRWMESYVSIDIFHHGYYKQSCTCWKDCLYWIAPAFILTFNLSDEIFEIISSPLDCFINSLHNVLVANFGFIKESLALYVETVHENLSVWVLKKELSEGGGIRSSWSKLFSIDDENWIYFCPHNFGLCGELLLQRRNGRHRYDLGVWDFREHKFKKLGIEVHGYISDVYSYSESLVLLKELQS